MLASMPTIGVRFDIGKVSSGSYGVECWKVFWRAVPTADIKGSLLWEGDTAASMNGRENVYCIAVQNPSTGTIDKIRASLAGSEDFKKLCGDPMFVEGARCQAEPLPEAGKVDDTGTLVGSAWNARPALATVKKERQSKDEPSAERSPVPPRPRSGSDRTNDLPQLGNFEDLRTFIKRVFIPKDTDFAYEYWMTPEELCDVADQYADLLEVQFSEYSCPRSEDMCCIRFFQKDPPCGRPIELIGLFAFPSESDAAAFVKEYKSAPKYAKALPSLAGMQGKYQLNFGKGSENGRDVTYDKENEVRPDQLWEKLWIRRQRFAADLKRDTEAELRKAEEQKRRDEDISRRRAEEQQRAAEDRNRKEKAEAVRRAEQEKQQQLMEQRAARRECRLCGKPLVFLDRLLGRTAHRTCRSFSAGPAGAPLPSSIALEDSVRPAKPSATPAAAMCKRCKTAVFRESEFHQACKEAGLHIDEQGRVALRLGNLAGDMNSIATGLQRQQAEQQARFERLEEHKGFECTGCKSVYCMNCLFNFAPAHPRGGKGCPGCGSTFQVFK
ncbi:MAG: MAP7 domain-containing protein [Gemmatimonadota bacterium]